MAFKQISKTTILLESLIWDFAYQLLPRLLLLVERLNQVVLLMLLVSVLCVHVNLLRPRGFCRHLVGRVDRAPKRQKILRFESTRTFWLVIGLLRSFGVYRLNVFRQFLVALYLFQGDLDWGFGVSYAGGSGLGLDLRVASFLFWFGVEDVLVASVACPFFGNALWKSLRHARPVLLNAYVLYLFVDGLDVIVDLPLVFETLDQSLRN